MFLGFWKKREIRITPARHFPFLDDHKTLNRAGGVETRGFILRASALMVDGGSWCFSGIVLHFLEQMCVLRILSFRTTHRNTSRSHRRGYGIMGTRAVLGQDPGASIKGGYLRQIPRHLKSNQNKASSSRGEQGDSYQRDSSYFFYCSALTFT